MKAMTPREALAVALKAINVHVDEEAAGKVMHELRKIAFRVGKVSRGPHEKYLRQRRERGETP